MMQAAPESDCPCGANASLADCCLPYLTGRAYAPTAETLMRSRYSAYVLGNADYLLASWHPETRPAALDLDQAQQWLGLKIRRAVKGGEQDTKGLVEFVARFKIAGRGHRLHEISRFERLDGRWVYLDGERGATDSSLKG